MADQPDPAELAVTEEASRTMLARARSTARARPATTKSKTKPEQRSSSRPDGRDPQTADRILSDWLRDTGYAESVASGGVEAHWETIVGDDVAAHVRCEPTDTTEGRVLVLRADSTAWATQIRLLLPEIRRRITTVIGRPVEDTIKVVGPAPPRRAPGALRVPGRGPRDTYG